MSAADLLIELGTEELPPKALPVLSRHFEQEILKGLADAGLGHGACHSFASPRRLAVLVGKVARSSVGHGGKLVAHTVRLQLHADIALTLRKGAVARQGGVVFAWCVQIAVGGGGVGLGRQTNP